MKSFVSSLLLASFIVACGQQEQGSRPVATQAAPKAEERSSADKEQLRKEVIAVLEKNNLPTTDLDQFLDESRARALMAKLPQQCRLISPEEGQRITPAVAAASVAVFVVTLSVQGGCSNDSRIDTGDGLIESAG